MTKRAKTQAERELRAQQEDDADAAERDRRKNNPTDNERMGDRLSELIIQSSNPEIVELARILKWMVTGSEW